MVSKGYRRIASCWVSAPRLPGHAGSTDLARLLGLFHRLDGPARCQHLFEHVNPEEAVVTATHRGSPSLNSQADVERFHGALGVQGHRIWSSRRFCRDGPGRPCPCALGHAHVVAVRGCQRKLTPRSIARCISEIESLPSRACVSMKTAQTQNAHLQAGAPGARASAWGPLPPQPWPCSSQSRRVPPSSPSPPPLFTKSRRSKLLIAPHSSQETWIIRQPATPAQIVRWRVAQTRRGLGWSASAARNEISVVPVRLPARAFRFEQRGVARRKRGFRCRSIPRTTRPATPCYPSRERSIWAQREGEGRGPFFTVTRT